jgi:DMSO/TMAO reductase YedYZ molybdopterin-dependent catalytic subunit
MAQVVAVAGAAVAGVFAGKYLEKKENDKDDAEPMELGDHVLALDGPANFDHEEDMYKMKYLSNKWPEVRSLTDRPTLSDRDQKRVVVTSPDPTRDDPTRLHLRIHPDSRRTIVPPTSTQVLPEDVKTPDNWVQRHPSLIRLTGKHPFNVEAPPAEIYDVGFISPVNLHIVRNHGAVPKLDWDTHRIEISGNVSNPYSIGMDELTKMPSDCFPCLVVCAGNRRKEQNMIKKSIGFNWGPAAVGNTYWKGVPLRLILNRAGIYKPGPGRRFVCLAGPEGELPKSYDGQDGGVGSYGTSIDMETALDPTCDVIVAYEQNGDKLHPDHGYPCRVLIPGYIGGRMIKFLSKIIVTDEESKNFYHFNDNRVLPVGVDAQLATDEGWWFKPEYIINNLNINGAIIHPKHEEVLHAPTKTYQLKGYAYSGGGRKVIRAELSFDQGQSWKLANINVREKPRWAAGSSGDKARHWCWCHWELEVDANWLRGCNEICFRAFDQSQNSMPERPTWNVMGMLNNPWYRIRVHALPNGGFHFEHPTIAGPTPGGWMQKMAEKAGGELLWGWGGEGGPAAPPRAPNTPPEA